MGLLSWTPCPDGKEIFPAMFSDCSGLTRVAVAAIYQTLLLGKCCWCERDQLRLPSRWVSKGPVVRTQRDCTTWLQGNLSTLSHLVATSCNGPRPSAWTWHVPLRFQPGGAKPESPFCHSSLPRKQTLNVITEISGNIKRPGKSVCIVQAPPPSPKNLRRIKSSLI